MVVKRGSFRQSKALVYLSSQDANMTPIDAQTQIGDPINSFCKPLATQTSINQLVHTDSAAKNRHSKDKL